MVASEGHPPVDCPHATPMTSPALQATLAPRRRKPRAPSARWSAPGRCTALAWTAALAGHLLGVTWVLAGARVPQAPPVAPEAIELAWLADGPSDPSSVDRAAPAAAGGGTPLPPRTAPAGPARPAPEDAADDAPTRPAAPTAAPSAAVPAPAQPASETRTGPPGPAAPSDSAQGVDGAPKASGPPSALAAGPPPARSLPPHAATAPVILSIGAVGYLEPPELQYPPAARRAQEEGRALVRVLVDATGHPQRTALERSTGHTRLDDAALATAAATRFRPHTENGVARAFWVVMPFVFELEN